ncbi:hypothetical protein U8335_02465 [Roseiconus lacunae]|nr:hypothetical protein [Roseiconus lacunae]WRQ51407.1 hypothetical protein U8335_02465 [Stieleria sp. HD01]
MLALVDERQNLSVSFHQKTQVFIFSRWALAAVIPKTPQLTPIGYATFTD